MYKRKIAILQCTLVILSAFLLTGCPDNIAQVQSKAPNNMNCTKLKYVFQVPPVECSQTGNTVNCIPAIGIKVPEIITNATGLSGSTTGFAGTKPGEKGITEWMIAKMSTVLSSVTKTVFEAISTNIEFRRMIGALASITITLYAFSVILGITNATPYTVTMLCIKIIVIFFLITDWNNFNNLIIGFFDGDSSATPPTTGLVQNLSSVMAKTFTGSSNYMSVFKRIDETISMFFSFGYMTAVLALVFTGWHGAFFALLLIALIFSYLFAILYALSLYLRAMVGRYLLYAIAPLFITFAMFRFTKSLFDGWFEQLLSFVLQPIFIFAVLGMLHLMISGFWDAMLTNNEQKICYREFLKISSFIMRLNWWQFGDGKKGSKEVHGWDADIPFDMWSLFTLIILSYLLFKMIRWSADLAARISGGFLSVTQIPIHGWNVVSEAMLSSPRSALSAAKGSIVGSKGTDGVRRGGIFNIRQNGHWQRPAPFTGASAGLNRAREINQKRRRQAIVDMFKS